MRIHIGLIALLALLTGSPSFAVEQQAYLYTEEFGQEPLYDGVLQYFYYIPCPEPSWFYSFYGFEVGDVIGEWFEIGDLSTGGFGPCDPADCHTLEQFRVLSLAGYGVLYPEAYTVEFNIYCSDAYGCPVGPSLWNSEPVETRNGWNYFTIDPPLSICPCAVDPGPPPSTPRMLITLTHTGDHADYHEWACDCIGEPVLQGCAMHDFGCTPALYPRPYVSHYSTMHSGYYGKGFEFCPPQWLKDKRDTTADGSQYGFVELAWRIYLICSGPSGTEATTWSDIKSMYR